MEPGVWKAVSITLLGAVIAGAGSLMALGKDSASRTYVDNRVEKSESRTVKRLESIERKVDAVLLKMK